MQVYVAYALHSKPELLKETLPKLTRVGPIT
jgi:hypothetical protein